MKRRKVWVGLGTAILVTPSVAAIAAAPAPMPQRVLATHAASEQTPVVVAQNAPRAHARGGGEGEGHRATAKPRRSGGEGGEGGEGRARATKAKAGGEGEGGEGGKDARLAPSLRFYRDIQRLRGHLVVGDELVREGRWKEALPHFQHPEKEIYGELRAGLKTHGVPPFAAALQALAKTVKAKDRAGYAKALAAVEERLAAVDRSLRAQESDWPAFAVEAAVEMLRSAADEYGKAVDGERIRNVVEYQDAHGFVVQAERLVATVADDLARKDADAAAAIRAALADLNAGLPGPMPPQKPVSDLSRILGDISRIELQLGRLR